MQLMGWGALTLAIAGVAGPVGTDLYCQICYRDDLGWQEGAAFYVFCACLFVLAVIETLAFLLGRRARATIPGLLAIGLSALVLSVVAALIVYLTWDYAVGSGALRH